MFGARILVARIFFRVQAAVQQLQRAHDDGQHIVEIVGDPAGQLTDRLHLLRLAQLFLEAALFGDVDADTGAAARVAVRVEIGIAARQQPAHRSVGMDDAVFQLDIARIDQAARHGRAQHRPVVGMDIGQEIGAQQPPRTVRRIERIELGNPGVEKETVAFDVEVPDADAANRAQGQAGKILRVAQGLFARPNLGDVARRAIDETVLLDRVP